MESAGHNGYLSAEGLRKAIATTRTLTGAPFGVNLFVPSAPGDPAQVADYAEPLGPLRAGAGWRQVTTDPAATMVRRIAAEAR